MGEGYSLWIVAYESYGWLRKVNYTVMVVEGDEDGIYMVCFANEYISFLMRGARGDH